MLFEKKKETERIAAALPAFETVTLELTGMRMHEVYEIVQNGAESTVSRYGLRYENGADRREPEGAAVLETAAVLEKLEAFGVASWNGFHGRHPRGVLDGMMFTLRITAGGETLVFADGSENFPRHFRKLLGWLGDLVRGETDA